MANRNPNPATRFKPGNKNALGNTHDRRSIVERTAETLGEHQGMNKALNYLGSLLDNNNASDRVRIKAAEILLAYRYGKPKETVATVNLNELSATANLSADQLEALVHAIIPAALPPASSTLSSSPLGEIVEGEVIPRDSGAGPTD
jgi:hypothetical protein